jgi:hypothetical protein
MSIFKGSIVRGRTFHWTTPKGKTLSKEFLEVGGKVREVNGDFQYFSLLEFKKGRGDGNDRSLEEKEIQYPLGL